MKLLLTILFSVALLSPGAVFADDDKPAAKPKVTKPAPKVATPATKPAVKASTPASAPVVPVTVKDAASTAKGAYDAGRAHQWWYMSSLLCLLVMFILKITGALAKMGRAKYIVLPILSLGAGLLAAFQGGVGIETAVGVFSSTWATGMLEELWNHGIMGKAHG